MKPILKLTDRLLAKGHNLHNLGLEERALPIFDQLSRFRNLPDSVKKETHLQLARLYRNSQKHRRARKHLAVVMTSQPKHANHQQRMGSLVEADGCCDPQRALRHYRRAVRLDPDNARRWSALAKCALRLCRDQLALRAARKAYRLAPEDAVVLKRYVKILQHLKRFAEGIQVLRRCRFRLNGQPWLEQLRGRFRFAEARHEQQTQHGSVPTMTDDAVCVLPFPTANPQANDDGAEFVRHDEPAILQASHLPMRLHRPDQRYA